MHVTDASRAVPVTTSLLSEDGHALFVEQHRAEYEAIRKAHSAPRQAMTPINIARARRTPIEWRTEDIATPAFTGVRIVNDVSLAHATRVHRLVAVLSYLGIEGALPAHPR